jgi:hypothetical protein
LALFAHQQTRGVVGVANTSRLHMQSVDSTTGGLAAQTQEFPCVRLHSSLYTGSGSQSTVFAQRFAIPILAMLVGAPLGGLAAQTWRETESRTYFALIAALYALPALYTLLIVVEGQGTLPSIFPRRSRGGAGGAEGATASVPMPPNNQYLGHWGVAFITPGHCGQSRPEYDHIWELALYGYDGFI